MIQQLIIENFRNLQRLELSLQKVNWCIGPEGSGKSSILAGLQHLFTGTNEWTDGKGSGADQEIRDGAKKAVIQAAIVEGELGHLVERTIPSKGTPEIPWSKDVVLACLTSRSFFGLSAKEQRSLLFGLIGADVDYIGELDRWTPEFPGLGRWFQGMTEVSKKCLYDSAYTSRTAANKRRDTAKKVLEAAPITPEPPKVSEKTLSDAREAYNEEVRRIGELAGRSSGAQAAYVSALAAYNQEIRSRQQHDAEIKHLEGELTPTDFSEDRKYREHCIVAKEWTEAGAELQQVRKVIDTLIQSEEPCQKGACAKQEIKRLRTEENLLDCRVLSLGQEEAGSKYEEQNIADKQAGFDRTRKRLAELRLIQWGPMTQEPKAPEQATAPGQPAPEVVNRLQALQDAAKLHGDWAAKEAEKVHLRRELEEAEQEAAKWDACVKALAPDGIEARVLGPKVQEFLKSVKPYLQEFGFGCAVTLEPWAVEVQVPGKPLRPATFLSHSEQARASVAWQIAIAELSGFGLIAVDEHGMGPLKREELLDTLLKAPVQSFVFSTLQDYDDDWKPQFPAAILDPDVQTICLLNGQVVLQTIPVA